MRAFNHVTFSIPSTNDVTSGNFGRITYQMNLPRELQLGLRLMF